MAKKSITETLEEGSTKTKSAANWMKKLVGGVASIASAEENKPKTKIAFPSPSFNWALGGGLVRGKTAMFFGPESAGKTMLAMLAVVQDQLEDGNGIWIWYNAEFSFNAERFTQLGGDADRLLLVNSNHYQDIYEHFFKGPIKKACEEGAPIKGVVVDSVRAVIYPKDSKFEDDTASSNMGGVSATFLTSALKFWLETQVKFGITTIFIQQVGLSLDIRSGEKWTTSGGKALDHACDYKILIEKDETKTSGKILSEGSGLQIGHVIKCQVKKNRLGVPQRKARMNFVYNRGVVDQLEEVYELAKTIGIIKHPEGKGTSYWQIGDGEPVYGEKKLLEMFKESKEIQDEVIRLCESYTGDVGAENDEDGKFEINKE